MVRFYLDADVLGLARLICQERSDCTYPGDPGIVIRKRRREPCPVTSPGAKDPDWIPVVARLGWLIITRDRHINERLGELQVVRDHGAKIVNLAGTDAGTIWKQLEIVVTRWREIELLADEAGPFICSLSRTGRIQPIDLDKAIAAAARRRGIAH